MFGFQSSSGTVPYDPSAQSWFWAQQQPVYPPAATTACHATEYNMPITSIRVEREMVYQDSVWVLVSVEATPQMKAQSWGFSPLDAGGVAKALVGANDNAVRKAMSNLYSTISGFSAPQSRYPVAPPEPLMYPGYAGRAGAGPVPTAQASEAPSASPSRIGPSSTSTRSRISQHPAWSSATGVCLADPESQHQLDTSRSSVSLDINYEQQRSRVPLSRHRAWMSATRARRVSEPSGPSPEVPITSDQDAARRTSVSNRISLHPAWKSANAHTLETSSAAPRSSDSTRSISTSTTPTSPLKSVAAAPMTSDQDTAQRACVSKRISLHPAWKSASSFTLERPVPRRGGDSTSRVSLHPAWKSASNFNLETKPSELAPRSSNSQQVSSRLTSKPEGSLTLDKSSSVTPRSSDSANSITLNDAAPKSLDNDDALSVKVSKSCPRTSSSTAMMQSFERILIIGADAVNLKVMTRVLNRRGTKVTCGMDGLEVIEQCIAWNQRFDVIVIDEHMHYMTVTSATAALRKYEQEHGLQRTPVVVTTANLAPDNMQNYSKSGVDGFIAKPVNMRHLPDMLGAYVSKRLMKGTLSRIHEDGNTGEVSLSSVDEDGIIMGAMGIKKGRPPVFENSTMFGDLEIFGELTES